MQKILNFISVTIILAVLLLTSSLSFAEDSTIVAPSLNSSTAEITTEKNTDDAGLLESLSKEEIKSSTIDTKKNLSETELAKDLGKMRDILVESAGDKPLLRGMMLPLFQPIFIAIMFVFGLWASQIIDRVPIMWSVPAALFGGVILAAFIDAFHTEWKPDMTFKDNPYIPDLTSVEVAATISALAIGFMVFTNRSLSPLLNMLFAGCIGLINGFSQTSIDTGGNFNAVLFWMGFALTGLFLNIIGIGFETFMKSLHLPKVTQFCGLAAIGLGIILAIEIF